jgi:Rps23 Pro-64 3,4-dihydroxylase Tpa1-like proline 4-hydroxylase
VYHSGVLRRAAVVIDFDAIASAELQSTPYEWALVERAIDPGQAASLIDTFPVDDFWRLRHDDGEKSYTYSARPLVILGEDRPASLSPLPDPWQELVRDLLSPRYREALSQAIGQALDGAPMEVAVWRWDEDAQLGPHLDMREKLVTQVFYLNAGWNPWWGGCLRILNSKDESDLFSEIPPILGSSSVLVRSDRSWHCVSPVADTPVPRRSVIVTWFEPGSESPSWYEDPDGAVQSHARPPGGVRQTSPETARVAALEARVAELDRLRGQLADVRSRKSVRWSLAFANRFSGLRRRLGARF